MSTYIIPVVLLTMVACSAYGETNDVLFSVTESADPVYVNENIIFTISITNAGPDAATNVVMTDVLPASVDLVSCVPSQGTWTQEEDIITCTLGQIDAAMGGEVVITVTPTMAQTITNSFSISGDTGAANNRLTETTLVRAPNHPPQVVLDAVYTFPVGSTTGFVTVPTDPDHDTGISITKLGGPAAATFVASNFTWTAGVADIGTTTIVYFVANDHQAATNSVTTNSTLLVVPFDADSDSMSDEWEWTQFGTLAQDQSGDADGDGMDNYHEYVSGTSPTNDTSSFQMNEAAENPANGYRTITTTTEPNRMYTIEYRDGNLLSAGTWSTFANLADGIGTWTETGPVASTYSFVDDLSANTTGGAPADGTRYYRVKVELP